MDASILNIFKNIPTLKTERLTLRKITTDDLNDVYEYSKDPVLTQYLLWYPHPDREYTAKYLSYLKKQYAKGEFFDWALEYEGKMIGTCGFSSFDLENDAAEVGYVINTRFRGKGLATEGMREVLKFGFETLKLNRIYARIMTPNERSISVAERLSMRKEGRFYKAVKAKGSYNDIFIYAITKDEYEKAEV